MSHAVRLSCMRILPLCVVAGVVVLGAAATPAHAEAKIGDRAADFTLPALDGSKVKLSELKGSVVVVDFWASWCVPCNKELPALDALARRYAEAGKPVVVLAVNIDKERDNAEKLVAQARIATLLVLLDPAGAAAAAYDLPTMPTSYVIDAKGVVRSVHAGYSSGDERKLADDIDRLLGARGP